MFFLAENRYDLPKAVLAKLGGAFDGLVLKLILAADSEIQLTSKRLFEIVQ
jgi:hypothetical protein